MTYAGEDLQLLTSNIGNKPNIWSYKSADVDSAVNAADYFSDGVTRGMKVGDMVWVYDTTTPKGSCHYVSTVSGNAATTAFAAVA
jgi:hypothetical protein